MTNPIDKVLPHPKVIPHPLTGLLFSDEALPSSTTGKTPCCKATIEWEQFGGMRLVVEVFARGRSTMAYKARCQKCQRSLRYKAPL